MTTAKEKVLELISSGKVTSAEGEELLKALQKPRGSLWRLLVNPFERLSVAWTLILGGLGAVCGLLLSKWNVRFNGALDLHLAPSLSLPQAVVDQIFAWPLAAMVLWIAAVGLARQGRVIDFIGFVGTARLPFSLAGVALAVMRDQLPTDLSKIASMPRAPWLIFAGIQLPLVIWTVTWLFMGYRTASGLRGTKCGVSFTLAFIFAEVFSKVGLYWIHL